MKELILREFWWPKIKKDIEAYVKGCETCQRTKSSTQAKAAPLHLNAIPEGPWTHISVDMVTSLPDSHGHDAILMIVDRFSKAIIPVACNVELSTEGWAESSETMLRQAWYASGHHLRPRTPVRLTVHEGVIPNAQHHAKCLHSLPPTDRRTDRTSKSRGQEVPPNLCQSPTNRLERLAPSR